MSHELGDTTATACKQGTAEALKSSIPSMSGGGLSKTLNCKGLAFTPKKWRGLGRRVTYLIFKISI